MKSRIVSHRAVKVESDSRGVKCCRNTCKIIQQISTKQGVKLFGPCYCCGNHYVYVLLMVKPTVRRHRRNKLLVKSVWETAPKSCYGTPPVFDLLKSHCRFANQVEENSKRIFGSLMSPMGEGGQQNMDTQRWRPKLCLRYASAQNVNRRLRQSLHVSLTRLFSILYEQVYCLLIVTDLFCLFNTRRSVSSRIPKTKKLVGWINRHSVKFCDKPRETDVSRLSAWKMLGT